MFETFGDVRGLVADVGKRTWRGRRASVANDSQRTFALAGLRLTMI